MHSATNFMFRLAAGVAATTLVAVSCTQDFDELFTNDTPAGGGGSGGSVVGGGGSGGSVGGSGGGVGCLSPTTCPGNDSDCAYRSCEQGVCDIQVAPVSTPCDDGAAGAEVCDGEGHCVECTTPEDCEPFHACQQELCVPLQCADGLLNGQETDVDCGGSECAPCADGLVCVAWSDCQSGFCDNGTCGPCGNDADCDGPDTWCDGGSCSAKKADGDVCAAGNECLSGNCPGGDGVCCDVACGEPCRACLSAKTGSANGTCDWVSAASDPDGECGAEAEATCGSSGAGCSGDSSACILWDPSTVCGTEICTGSTLTSVRNCDGSGTCEAGTSQSCAPYTCNGGGTACLTSCSDSTECVSGHYCGNGGVCQPSKPTGQPCAEGAECVSGHCPPEDGICCNQACDAQCVACLGSKTGGTDGQCAVVQTDTDPDLECQDGGGPCGPNGDGCAGTLGDAYCQGYSCSCSEQYDHAAILDQCFESVSECQLRVATSASCDQICAAGGGSCTRVYNNTSNNSCNPSFGQQRDCATVYGDAGICFCSRGCGGNASCVAPLACINDLCR